MHKGWKVIDFQFEVTLYMLQLKIHNMRLTQEILFLNDARMDEEDGEDD